MDAKYKGMYMSVYFCIFFFEEYGYDIFTERVCTLKVHLYTLIFFVRVKLYVIHMYRCNSIFIYEVT